MIGGRIAGALGALSLVLAAPAMAGPLDAAVAGAQLQGFAGEILVTDARQVIYATAVSAPGRPHRRGDLWRWASVSKQVTATLLMQEVEAGRLGLEDRLTDRLPGFGGPTGGAITLRSLLQHTSGLPDPDDAPDFYLRDGADVGGRADALGYCAGAPRQAPGAGFHYDNCDFIVLGAVLEAETRKSYAALVRERIARPLASRTLRLADAGLNRPATTPGRLEDGGAEPPLRLRTFGASGGLVGTSDDLARFDQALLSGRLLSAEARQTAWAGDPRLGYVALGAWGFPAALRGCAGAVKLVERRGEIGGVEVRNLIAPDLGRALVVFADRAGLEFGEVWQGRGLTYDLASAAFCATAAP